MDEGQGDGCGRTVADGEYRSWRWSARLPIIFCAAYVAWVIWQMVFRRGTPVEAYEWVGIGLLVLIGVADAARTLAQPRRAGCDPTGIEFVWHLGAARRYDWDEVIGLDDKDESQTWLLTSTNERILLEPGARGYEDLVAAVRAHLDERRRLEE